LSSSSTRVYAVSYTKQIISPSLLAYIEFFH
jgi:hypothetical protein